MKRILPNRKAPLHTPVFQTGMDPTIVFITVCSAERKTVLACGEIHDLLRNCWSGATAWLVGRYVIMPDHIHLFCAPSAELALPLANWMRFWKSRASRQWPRLEEQPVWQDSFWDTKLRSDERYGEKWEYVRRNPVRAGLCQNPDDWPYQGELNALDW